MQWHIEFLNDSGLEYVRVTTGGQYTLEGQAGMVKDVLDSPQWQIGMPAIFDHRALKFEGVNINHMIHAGTVHQANDSRIGPTSTVIIVADRVAYGIVNQFLSLTSDEIVARIHVTLDASEALDWLRSQLGIDSPDIGASP